MTEQKAELVPIAELQELQKKFDALRRQDIRLLGQDEVFCRMTPTGRLQSIKGAVKLEEALGDLSTIQGRVMVGGKGFMKANRYANLTILTPKTQKLPDGKSVPNPFYIFEDETQTIRKVWIKKMAVGFSPAGVLVVSSATLLYDVNLYFIEELAKKVKHSKEAGKFTVEAALTDDERRTGIFRPIDGKLGVWVNLGNKDIISVIENFTQAKVFAERKADTICARLAMAKHPALSHMVTVSPTGFVKAGDKDLAVAIVPVIGYIHDLTIDQLQEAAERAERGEEFEINGEKVEVVETAPTTATTDDVQTETDPEEIVQEENEETGGAPVGGSVEDEERGPSLFSQSEEEEDRY
mgnify:CR=1 FL=1